MRKLIAVIAAALLTVGGTTAAHADELDLHPDVEYAINAVPGGTVVDEYTVVWPELSMTLTAPAPGQRAVGTCATGQYCAYSEANRGGTKLTFGVCTIVSTSALSSVGSIANARSAGNVQARNSSLSVLGTASAGSSVNVVGGTSTLRCTL